MIQLKNTKFKRNHKIEQQPAHPNRIKGCCLLHEFSTTFVKSSHLLDCQRCDSLTNITLECTIYPLALLEFFSNKRILSSSILNVSVFNYLAAAQLYLQLDNSRTRVFRNNHYLKLPKIHFHMRTVSYTGISSSNLVLL